MAPVITRPHKSNGHKRYLPEETKSNLRTNGFSLEESDQEANALQIAAESEDEEFQGFGRDEEVEGQENEKEDSDKDSIKIDLGKQKFEKPILPKDAEEEELERMIFGDSAGFKQGLDDFALHRTAGTYGDESDESQDEDEDLEGVADQDLFFFDAGPVPAAGGSLTLTKKDESEDEYDKPAWDDSDDERLVVSLASVPQLKKLRETADDDMVNGKEYARRLRKQYERLYPTPEWAMHAIGKANKKRRRVMDDDESGEESASDMELDEEDLTTQPLARLLRDADILSYKATGPVKRRKLQAGTVNIQRLKDVSKAGPVCRNLTHGMYCLLTFYTVCHHITLIPPDLPYPSLIWTQLNVAPASHQLEPTTPKPTPHLASHKTYTSYHNRISSFTIRFAHLLERTSPLLSHMEYCYWQGRKDFAYLWPPARTAHDGVLFALV